jgi:hypothetical protein
MRVRAVVHLFIAIILLAPDCCLPGAWDRATASTEVPQALTDYRVGVRSASPSAGGLETDAFSILRMDRLSVIGSHLARRGTIAFVHKDANSAIPALARARQRHPVSAP